MARAAYSLNVLLEQLNNHAPNRSKASDGGIGDTAHIGRESDHNPDARGIYHARDYTHDPDGGLDCHWLAQQLHKYKDARVKYVIWNRLIWSPAISDMWRRYSGTNPHTKHLHLSVKTINGDQNHIWRLYDIPPLPILEESDMLLIGHEKTNRATFIGNGVNCRHIRSPKELENVQYILRTQGIDATDHEFADGTLFGVLGIPLPWVAVK